MIYGINRIAMIVHTNPGNRGNHENQGSEPESIWYYKMKFEEIKG